MRHAPAHPEQTPSPIHKTHATINRERASLEQQRADLVRALVAAEQSAMRSPPGSQEQGKARARVTRLQQALRLIKGRLGIARQHRDLGDLLIQICKERATRCEWQRIVAEAQRRYEAQE